MSDVEKIYMTWEKFDKDINSFVQFVEQYEFHKDSVVLALKRGGFPTSAAISNKMNLPVSTVAYQTRDGNDSKPTFLEPELIKKATKVIIPDDIYDTGITMENTVKALINDFNVELDNIMGLFHYGSEKVYNTDLKFYRVIDNNYGKWVQYPWE